MTDRIGLIFEGDSEFNSFRHLLPQLRSQTGHTFLNPLKADIQPKSPDGRIVSSCKSQIKWLTMQRATRIIVSFDREDHSDCPGTWSNKLSSDFSSKYGVSVSVVLKDRTFENWLIADLEAFDSMSSRFSIPSSSRMRIFPNKADQVDGYMEICKLVNGSYSKVSDSVKILSHANILRMSEHSRSFRRLLRILEHPSYLHQSKRPHNSL